MRAIPHRTQEIPLSTSEVRARIDMKLEVVVIPVSDVDRAKAFYERIGWRFNFDRSAGEDSRLVQFTPPGSCCSVHFGKNVTSAAPGSAKAFLIVADIQAAREPKRWSVVLTADRWPDVATSASDAVDGSSTGTRVPRSGRPHLFGGESYAINFGNRSGYSDVGLSSAWLDAAGQVVRRRQLRPRHVPRSCRRG